MELKKPVWNPCSRQQPTQVANFNFILRLLSATKNLSWLLSTPKISNSFFVGFKGLGLVVVGSEDFKQFCCRLQETWVGCYRLKDFHVGFKVLNIFVGSQGLELVAVGQKVFMSAPKFLNLFDGSKRPKKFILKPPDQMRFSTCFSDFHLMKSKTTLFVYSSCVDIRFLRIRHIKRLSCCVCFISLLKKKTYHNN